MKLLSFSDIHLDAVTAGRRRRSEVVQFLRTVWEIVQREEIDMVLFAGDAYDSGDLLDPLYSSDLIREFLAFPRSSIGSILVAIAGNHDVIDTSELFDGAPVTTLTPLRAASRCMADYEAELVHVLERPQFVAVDDEVGVLALPYVSRVHFPALPAWIEEAFALADEWCSSGKKLIVVGHLVVPGAAMSSESVEMAKGQDQLFPFEMVERLKPSLVINGHYHARQLVQHGELTVAIPGSPLRFTFGEAAEVAKGVLIAEI